MTSMSVGLGCCAKEFLRHVWRTLVKHVESGDTMLAMARKVGQKSMGLLMNWVARLDQKSSSVLADLKASRQHALQNEANDRTSTQSSVNEKDLRNETLRRLSSQK